MSNLTRRPGRAGAIGLATAVLWLTQLFLFPHIAVGQMQRENVRIALAGRRDLDSLADVASKQAADPKRDQASRQQSSSTAAAIRARLEEGDFRVGDRIIVYVRGDTSLSNTFNVREGVILKLPNLPDIPLRGVLRSEIEEKVRGAVAHYLRDPDVRVGSLVRIGVMGQVVHPGYYQMAADMLLSDALMTAGGPTPLASSDKIIIRRGSQDLWDAESVREFMAGGATLAQVDFHSGDEIVVQEQTRHDWVTISQIVAAMSGAVLGFVYLTRKH